MDQLIQDLLKSVPRREKEVNALKNGSRSIEAQLILPVPCVPMIMTARPNCDYLVSIEWMRYQRQWVPYRICVSVPLTIDKRRFTLAIKTCNPFPTWTL
ncbi:hypothetical protein TNCV_2827851 [Trichonephila clavipes]|nr:hypothetical protein TNCV_2827851 [Trichonephila clavipes]